MKVAIETLGCKVNTYESEYVMSLFKEKGYEIKKFDDVCDIYIINTCTVTNNSDSKSRKIINQAINKNKDSIIVAMGCFIEANKDIKIDDVDILIGNKNKSHIVELVEEFINNKKQIRELYQDLGSNFEDMEVKNFYGRTRAFVKIQDGCENFCTFCIIPYVRGKCRSKDFNKVIDEVNTLVENGYKEIVLTGIHTGNYGVEKNTNLSLLLEKILENKKLERLRISSIEITEITDKILDLIKNNHVIVDHLHIPLQSGSDTILKLMNRKYNTKYYQDMIEKLRSIRSNISITTDVIVGFPKESEELFLETYEFCKKIGFSKIHVFPYSRRKNTPADKFDNQVDNAVKKERSKRLIELSKNLEIEYMNKFLNKEVLVLIEKKEDNCSYGRTSNYLYVKVNKSVEKAEIVSCKIKKIEYPYLEGDINE